MPEAAEQPSPAPPLRTWRPMILWTGGIILALSLAGLVTEVAVPMWRLRTTLHGSPEPAKVVEQLGGPRRALWRLQLYSSLPDGLAPDGAKAVQALGWCGPEAVPVLLKALKSPDDATKAAAVHAIARGPLKSLAKDTVPALISLLKGIDVNLRAGAAQALGVIGPEARGSVPALRQALRVGAWPSGGGIFSQTLCRQALIALGAIGPDAREALPDALSFLAGQDEVLKADAVLAVAGISRDPKLVIAAYTRIAASGERLLYLYEINQEMRGIGSGGEALAPLAERLMADKDDAIRAFASRILRQIPGHESTPIVEHPPIPF